MKYIRDFETVAAFQAAQATLDRPNVSLIDATMDVNYLPYIDPYNGHDYVDFGLPSGTLWATVNIGASNPEDIGYYFQWADPNGYYTNQIGSEEGQHNFSLANSPYYDSTITDNYSKYNPEVDNNVNLDSTDDAASVIWQGSWHTPSKTQVEELINNTTFTWETDFNNTGVAGALFTSTTDNSKYIFIPISGFANGTRRESTSAIALSWTNENYSTDPKQSWEFNISSSTARTILSYRMYGEPIRPVIG